MSIISCNLVNRSGSWKYEEFTRSYVDTYEVFASRADDQTAVIGGTLSTLSFTIGVTIWASDTAALLQEANANLLDHTKTANKWHVVLTYKTTQPLEIAENPLLEETQFSGSYEKINRPLFKDLSADEIPILNSSGEPFEQCPEQTCSQFKISLTENYAWAGFNPSVFPSPLANTINSDTWCGYAPYTCLCNGISIKREKRNDVVFAQVTFEILVDEKIPWHPVRVLNCGYRGFPTGVGSDATFFEPTTLLDRGGNPYTKPRMLDAFGFELEIAAVRAGEVTYSEFQFYKFDDWSTMPTIPT